MIPSAVIQSKNFTRSTSTISDDETFTDLLERLIVNGDTEELDELIIYEDDRVEIRFRDDEWPFISSSLDFDGGATTLVFDVDSGNIGYENVLRLNNTITKMKFQLKVFVATYIYLSPNTIQLSTLKTKLSELKKLVPVLVEYGIDDFSILSNDHLDKIHDKNKSVFNTRTRLEGLNSLLDMSPWLPFDINYSKLKATTYSSGWKATNQTAVIPLRIYLNLLIWGKDRVNYYKSISSEIEVATEKLLNFEDDELRYAVDKIRHGYRKLTRSPTKLSQRFISELKKNNIPIVDHGRSPMWEKILEKVGYKIGINFDRLSNFVATIDGVTYNRSQLKGLLRDIAGTCGFVCLQLSGMRLDELYGAHIDFGAQKMMLNQKENEDTPDNLPKNKRGRRAESRKEIIYLLTTRQSKVTEGSQTKKDTFVTTKEGYDAFNVLSSLFRAFNKRFKGKDKRRMWAGFRSCQSVTPCDKTTIASHINNALLNLSRVDLSLNDDDLAYLNVSDPTKELGLGDQFSVTPHTLRRSLAYYLTGYELCSFPALKQQFSHLSIAMTRWYARNSSHFTKVYKEVNKGRIDQLADIYVRIYTKLANGERIAGGKGKEAAREVSRQGKNYFEKGENQNLLSHEYWVQQLTQGIKHIHVMAPGMACTNKLCSMRINIDLSECVDCEFDFIEDIAFAESSRMDAMRNIPLLKEQNDLTPSSLTKLVMTIRSAEKIMSDLGFNYDPYTLDDELSKMFIQTVDNTEAI